MRKIQGSDTDDIFRQAAAEASRMQRMRQYPVNEARSALNSLEDLMDAVERTRSSHFTPNEWQILVQAEGVLKEYVYDITH